MNEDSRKQKTAEGFYRDQGPAPFCLYNCVQGQVNIRTHVLIVLLYCKYKLTAPEHLNMFFFLKIDDATQFTPNTLSVFCRF